jgi:hypothetical protein
MMQAMIENPENPDYRLSTAVIHHISSLESLTGIVMISHITSLADHSILLLLQFLMLLHQQTTAFYFLFSIFYFHTFLT